MVGVITGLRSEDQTGFGDERLDGVWSVLDALEPAAHDRGLVLWRVGAPPVKVFEPKVHVAEVAAVFLDQVADGVIGDRRPSHCSASQAWNRSTSVNPSFAARRIEPTLAVWVASTTGSPGRRPSNQPSAAAHASVAYPNPTPAAGTGSRDRPSRRRPGGVGGRPPRSARAVDALRRGRSDPGGRHSDTRGMAPERAGGVPHLAYRRGARRHGQEWPLSRPDTRYAGQERTPGPIQGYCRRLRPGR